MSSLATTTTTTATTTKVNNNIIVATRERRRRRQEIQDGGAMSKAPTSPRGAFATRCVVVANRTKQNKKKLFKNNNSITLL